MRIRFLINTRASLLSRWFTGILCIVGLSPLFLPSRAFALFTDYRVDAARVPNGSIVVDGKPEVMWADVSSKSYNNTFLFNDYQKIVLLLSDNIRNANPALYYQAPKTGSVTMLAAYDNTALYFFFIVRENFAYNPSSLCTPTNLGSANAPMVFIDPAPWTVTNYGALFSKDGSGLVFGTSPQTVQIAKPTYPADPRIYYRNRTPTQDRFEILSLIPSGVAAISAVHSSQDNLTYGVEMKIPFWSGKPTDFNPGNSMFISWGYNRYDSAKASCDSPPTAYRWAKHYKSYGSADPKPAGWRAGDSTHYDPTRSWDGWGQLYLSPNLLATSDCRNVDMTVWDLTQWRNACGSQATGITPMRKNAYVKNKFESQVWNAQGQIQNNSEHKKTDLLKSRFPK